MLWHKLNIISKRKMQKIRNKIVFFLWPKKLPQQKSINAYICKTYYFISNLVLSPIGVIFYLLNIRFIAGTTMRQIGDISHLDFLIKENLIDSSRYKFICFYDEAFHDNPYLLKLYSKYLIFVESLFLKFILMPVSQIKFIQINITRHDVNCKKCDRGKIARNYNLLSSNPLVKIPNKDKLACQAQLLKHFNLKGEFVCLHARESGYMNNRYIDANRTTRNADINSYDLVIDKLIDKGYKVIRLGDISMKKANFFTKKHNGKFIDYAHSDIKSPMMDAYLLSNCKFLIACSSGPSDISTIFNVNTLLVNGYPMVDCLRCVDGDLSTFKKIVRIKTNEPLPFEQLFQEPWSSPLQHSELEKLGYKLLDNSRHELQAALQDFLDIQESGDKERYSLDIQPLLKKHHFSYQAAGNISRSFIDKYQSSQKHTQTSD